MTSLAFDEDAQRWATHIEKGHAKRAGVAVEEIRPIVAHKMGVAPGTVERLRKGRVKGIKTWLYMRLRAMVIEEIQIELRRQYHELHLALQSGVGPDESEILSVKASIAENERILREGAK